MLYFGNWIFYAQSRFSRQWWLPDNLELIIQFLRRNCSGPFIIKIIFYKNIINISTVLVFCSFQIGSFHTSGRTCIRRLFRLKLCKFSTSNCQMIYPSYSLMWKTAADLSFNSDFCDKFNQPIALPAGTRYSNTACFWIILIDIL